MKFDPEKYRWLNVQNNFKRTNEKKSKGDNYTNRGGHSPLLSIHLPGYEASTTRKVW